jgi:acetylglutamate kinase
VTDRETRDVAVMVFAGLLNKQLAAAISAARQPAVGISAADAQSFRAEPLVHNNVEGSLGYVGYLTGVNTKLLEVFWATGIVPVAACLGLGSDGELYNINADHMAAACAEYLQGDHLIYLTDVRGVLDGERILSSIACDEIGDLVQRKIVSGGMVLKLEAAKRALEGGVRGVHIVGGTIPDCLLAAVHAAESSAPAGSGNVPGTRVVREATGVNLRVAHSASDSVGQAAAHSAA